MNRVGSWYMVFPNSGCPRSIVFREINYLKQLGVKLYTDHVIGMIKSIDELLEEYDAVFLGTGAGLPWFFGSSRRKS